MSPPTVVLRAATVVTPRAALSPGEVVLEGGRVAAVRTARRGPAPPAGTVLAPGFVDLQVNGAGSVAVPEAITDAEWARLGSAVAAGGTTTWCPTIVSSAPDVTSRAIAAVGSQLPARGDRPAVAGAHLEGPYLAVAGAHHPADLGNAVPSGWGASLPPAVRIVTLAPELPGALEAVAALAGRGVLVGLGHSRCSSEVAIQAAAAGARLVTHLGNAMGPVHQRQPGLFGAALVDRRLAVSVIADLVHVHPDVLRLAFLAKGADRVVLVTDRVADSGLHRRRRSGVAPAPAGGTGLAAVPLAGTTAPMVAMVANCAALPGIGLRAAVTAASATPAGLLGLHDRGRLEPGRRGDVVGFLHHGTRAAVRAVWVAGRPVVPVRPAAPVGSPWWASPPPSASIP